MPSYYVGGRRGGYVTRTAVVVMSVPEGWKTTRANRWRRQQQRQWLEINMVVAMLVREIDEDDTKVGEEEAL